MAEIHMFVIWPRAMAAKERILADIARHAEILLSFDADWPGGMSAEEGYRRFYGTLLPDSAGKVKRAGAGAFTVIVVKIANPSFGLEMSQRGLERVNREMFGMKWRYREWTGGLHRIHGTLSVRESRRDVMMMTGHTVDEWAAGKVDAGNIRIFPGSGDWGSMAELLGYLNEVHPYVVMRNYENLPSGFDPAHDDVDMLVENAGECACLVGAEKCSSGAAYRVRVAGRDVKLDMREIGDGYCDEAWERRMLQDRVKSPAGIFVPSAEDAFYSLLYHVLYMKRKVSPDYFPKLRSLALAAKVDGCGFDDWLPALEAFMRKNGYVVSTPEDRSVRIDGYRANWPRHATEAAILFGIENATPVAVSSWPLELRARLAGGPVRIVYVPGDKYPVSRWYELQKKLSLAAPAFAARPLMWHVGSRGAYLVLEESCGRPVGELLDTGTAFPERQLDAIAESALELAKALDASNIVHRDINADTLVVSPVGGLSLTGFGMGLDRETYKTEPPYFRRNLAKRLIALGGDGVPRPGEWNDRHALAAVLRKLPKTPKLERAIVELESAARLRAGTCKVKTRKIKLRLALLLAEILLRGLASPRRRRSAAFVRVRRFAFNALFG